MRIADISGGLGNQMFQYIFGRYLEESTGEKVFFDDSYFFHTSDATDENKKLQNEINTSGVHNGYELEYVFPYATKPSLLSNFFTPDIWGHMLNEAKNGTSIEVQLRNGGVPDLKILHEMPSPNELDLYTANNIEVLRTPPNAFNSGLSKIQGNIYYKGYWINPSYLNSYKDVILKDLTFRPLEDEQNIQYAKAITDSECAVGVHIRRGDFVTIGWALNESYYSAQVKKILKTVPNTTFFVFSDQIDWCKQNRRKLGLPKTSVFVEGNFDYKNNYIDMQLMAMCNMLIVGRSSFSYLASLINRVDGFVPIQTRIVDLNDVAE